MYCVNVSDELCQVVLSSSLIKKITKQTAIMYGGC